MAISTERLLKTEKKTVILEALGDSKFSLSAQGIDKPITTMADEVFEVRANGKPLVLPRKSRDYDPSDDDAAVTVSVRSTSPFGTAGAAATGCCLVVCCGTASHLPFAQATVVEP
jgi:hypothetical protein